MRNLKKLLAVVVAICVLATFTIPAFAADETLAADTQVCADIGMLIGSGGGVTADYAATTPSRIQAAVMLLRLTGNYDEAAAFESEDNFADADKANWAKPLMAFLKAHPELGFIGDGTNFMPNNKITAQEYYKIVLTALGYEIPDDYEYADTLAFAEELGFAMGGDVEDFTVNALATATVEGLKLNVKDGAETLAAKLVEAGAIDKDAAIAAGLYADELKATVKQTGGKIITVSYNRALTAEEKTATKFTVKKGLVPYTVTATWTEDNKSVELAYQYNFVAGDYTVTVGEETFAVKVEAAKVAKIELKDEYLPLADNVTINYVVYNQFDEDMEMTASNLSISVYNITGAAAVPNASDAEVDLVTEGRGATTTAVLDDSIIITFTHASTGVAATRTIPVKAKAAPKNISFGQVVPLEDETRVVEGHTGLVLPYEIVDQYGNAYTMPQTAVDGADDNKADIDGIIFMTSKPDVVDPDTFAVDEDGVLTFDAGGAGTAVITATVPATGAYAVTNIVIEAAAGLKTFTISEPSEIVVINEQIEVPYVATDSLGVVIEKDDFTYGIGTGANNVNLVSSNSTVIDVATDFSISNGKLLLTPSDEGTAIVYAYVDGALQNSVTFTVNEAAVATQFVSASFNTLFEKDATYTVEADDLKIIDQYARKMDAAGISIATNASSVVSVADSVDLTAAGVGTAKLTITANGLTHDVTVKVIASGDIKSYKIADIGMVYADETAATTYEVDVKIEGKDASGKAVTLVNDAPDFITTNNASILAVKGTKVDGLKAGTAKVTAYLSGKSVATADVTVSDAAPVATTIAWADTLTLTTAQNAKDLLTIKDQYGVEMIIDTNVTVNFIDSEGKISVAGAPSVGTAKVKAVTNNGLTSEEVEIEITAGP